MTRDGPGRVHAPLLTRTEDGQGVGGGGQSDAQRAVAPEDSTSGDAAGLSR